MSDSLTIPTLASSDTSAAYAALVKGAAIQARSTAGVLRLSDADRADLLQRMTTNNIAILRPGQSAVTVLTSPVARNLFVFTVVARSDDLLLLPAPGQTQALARHLRGQIFFMDKVKVEDLSNLSENTQPENNRWSRVRIMGPNAAQTLSSLGVEATSLLANSVVIQDELLVVAQPHYEVPGFELVVHGDNVAAVLDALLAAGAHTAPDEVVEARRVELGRPAAGAEIVEDYSPLEAGLAWACAENKGCYTGQEIIARQITYDKVTKSLVGLRVDGPVAVGSELLAEGRSAGTVTSVAYSPALNAPVALAIVKRPYNTPGLPLRIGDQNATVVSLPIVE